MKFYKRKTPLLHEGLEKEVMLFILQFVKNTRGLTTHLDCVAGINGKWLKLEPIYNFRCSLLMKILLHMFLFCDEDELREEWNKLFDQILSLARKHAVVLGKKNVKRRDNGPASC